MSINFKLNIPAGSTNVKIYRSMSADNIFEGVPLFDGAPPGSTWVDTATVPPGLYHYAMQLVDSAGYSRRSGVTPFFYRNDWGPGTPLVAGNVARSGTPFIQGNADNGAVTLYGDTAISLPNHGAVTNWAAIAAAAQGSNTFPGVFEAQAAPTTPGALVMVSGKLIAFRFPTVGNGDLRYRVGTSQLYKDAYLLFQRIADYLDTISDGSTTYTVGGFKWRLRMFRKDMWDIFYPSAGVAAAQSVNGDFSMTTSGVAVNLMDNKFIADSAIGSPTGYMVSASTIGVVTTRVIPPQTATNFSMLHYFEYLGPA